MVNIIKDRLSLKEQDETVMSDLQKDFLKEELESMKPLEEGSVSIETVYVFETEEKIECSIYFRNGMDKNVIFNEVNIGLIDDMGNTVFCKRCNLSEVGELPKHSSRPYKIYFDKNEMINVTNKYEACKVSFLDELSIKNVVKVNEFEKLSCKIDENEKKMLNEFLISLPEVNVDSIDINTYNLYMNENGDIVIIAIVRNGYDRNVELKSMPVVVKDSNKVEFAKSFFELSEFTISALKARLIILTVPTDFTSTNTFDLGGCFVEYNLN